MKSVCKTHNLKTVGFKFLKLFLTTIKIIKWKSDSPVSITHVVSKLPDTLVNIKSTHMGGDDFYNMSAVL